MHICLIQPELSLRSLSPTLTPAIPVLGSSFTPLSTTNQQTNSQMFRSFSYRLSLRLSAIPTLPTTLTQHTHTLSHSPIFHHSPKHSFPHHVLFLTQTPHHSPPLRSSPPPHQTPPEIPTRAPRWLPPPTRRRALLHSHSFKAAAVSVVSPARRRWLACSLRKDHR